MSVRITMISVLMALSGGSGAVVSRYVGAKARAQANLATMQAVILMIAASGSLGILGILFAEPLMRLAGADAEVLPLAVRYARVIFAGLIAMEMVPSVGGMLNAAGAPHVMLSMTLWSMGTLVVMEPLLVTVLGIEGAALAMVLANTAGMLWGLGVLVRGHAPVRLDLRALRIDLPMIRRILSVAVPAVLQRGSPNLAMSVLMRLIASYGASTLAAWVVVRRIFNVVLIPGMSLTRTVPAMVGQNLGAAQPKRAARAVGLIARLTLGITVGTLSVLIPFAPQVMQLFSGDDASLTAGSYLLRWLSLGYLAYGLNLVFDAAQAGAGDTVSPMIINILTLWLLQVPLAYGLSRLLHLGANGIWIALILGWGAQLGLMYLRYRQGHWQMQTI
jgi:putative MATE family efflux protein